MSTKASKLGTGSFAAATGVSARRAAIAATTSAPTTGAPAPTEVRLGFISRNPANPRGQVGDLSGLESTLSEIGLIQPITVASVAAYTESRPERVTELDAGTRYVVVDGHRRHAAARNLGWDTIRVVINDDLVASDEALLEAAFVANVQREGMTDLEEAQALQQLVTFYGSQRKAATRLGISQGVISQRLSLLSLSPDLQAELAAGERTVEQVRGLAKLPADKQREAADERRDRAAKEREAKRAERTLPATPVGGDNAVITPGKQTKEKQSDYAVITVGDPTVPRQADSPQPAAPTPPPDLPWNDPVWFDVHLRRHMSKANRVRLVDLLQGGE